jgi:hypothetical protein
MLDKMEKAVAKVPSDATHVAREYTPEDAPVDVENNEPVTPVVPGPSKQEGMLDEGCLVDNATPTGPSPLRGSLVQTHKVQDDEDQTVLLQHIDANDIHALEIQPTVVRATEYAEEAQELFEVARENTPKDASDIIENNVDKEEENAVEYVPSIQIKPPDDTAVGLENTPKLATPFVPGPNKQGGLGEGCCLVVSPTGPSPLCVSVVQTDKDQDEQDQNGPPDGFGVDSHDMDFGENSITVHTDNSFDVIIEVSS